MEERYDCLIVGGGAAGIGMASVLQDLQVNRFAVLERNEVGSSFLSWPEEMKFITPSFTSNAYGMMDLNAVARNTSPAFTLGTEHPSGSEYAAYLQAIADYKELPVMTGVDVTSIVPDDGGFRLETSQGTLCAAFVIWAAGEFQYPKLESFPGAEYGIHNSQVMSWAELQGEQFIVVGGYESGVDAAIQLSKLGKNVTVIDRHDRGLDKGSSDPSVELSPYTKDRLRIAMETGRIEFLSDFDVKWIEESDDKGFIVYCENEHGTSHLLKTDHPPIMATGFHNSANTIENLIGHSTGGELQLTSCDESTATPGLFIVGPGVQHGGLKLCFIYKFRQRFAVVAHAIGSRLGLDLTPLDPYRQDGMYLDDLSCCGENCAC
ncbi:NAD(P)/FAD-dependent oxidoreductase [Paenibacillus sp. XY044]|uniref:NAD(P)/FAD-dependent oxidoreductase n=1 Tax=Paenibacillus sp. XY044 TaxID=2026089 RepID=UPI000B992ADE|nr:NAD(P)/FAD-dependent oxidoreductase [Paenibacillus sp. XY044]OZB95435.1 monooxygenase [Paenibacillus sp. XY044]